MEENIIASGKGLDLSDPTKKVATQFGDFSIDDLEAIEVTTPVLPMPPIYIMGTRLNSSLIQVYGVYYLLLVTGMG